jgi:hypothetical protein
VDIGRQKDYLVFESVIQAKIKVTKDEPNHPNTTLPKIQPLCGKV